MDWAGVRVFIRLFVVLAVLGQKLIVKSEERQLHFWRYAVGGIWWTGSATKDARIATQNKDLQGSMAVWSCMLVGGLDVRGSMPVWSRMVIQGMNPRARMAVWSHVILLLIGHGVESARQHGCTVTHGSSWSNPRGSMAVWSRKVVHGLDLRGSMAVWLRRGAVSVRQGSRCANVLCAAPWVIC
jgi:hypothetical protein